MNKYLLSIRKKIQIFLFKNLYKRKNINSNWDKINSQNFNYKKNDVSKILTEESIKHIRIKTNDLCKKLDLPIF